MIVKRGPYRSTRYEKIIMAIRFAISEYPTSFRGST
jgi:hypothetical protein